MKTESLAEFLKRGGTVKTIPAAEHPKSLSADLTEKAEESFFEQDVDFIEEISFGNELLEILSVDRLISSNEYKTRKPSWNKIWKFDGNS